MRATRPATAVSLPPGANELMIFRVNFTTPAAMTQAASHARQERARQRNPGRIVNIEGQLHQISADQPQPQPSQNAPTGQLLPGKHNNCKERANWMRYYCTPFSKSPQTAIGIVCDTRGARKNATLRVALQSVDSLSNDEENCCPITLEKFENSDVDFLPGERVLKNKPNLCIGVLPCGHKCGAVPLLYHMLISGVKCPMCRQGPDKPMRLKCIPPHLRDAMHKEESRIRREDIQRQNRESRLLVRQMMAEMHMEQYGVNVMFPPEYTVSVFFYTSRSMLPPASQEVAAPTNVSRAVYSTEYHVQQVSHSDFQMEPTDIRQLNEHLTTLGCTSMRLITHSREGDDVPVVVSNSGIFDINQLTSYPNTSPATFMVDGNSHGEFILSRSRPLIETHANPIPTILDSVIFRRRFPMNQGPMINIALPHLNEM